MRLFLVLLSLAAGLAAQTHWVATWGTAQQSYRAATAPGRGPAAPSAAPQPAPPPKPPAAATGPARRFPVPPSLATLNNQTVRMIARTSIAGRAVRVRLSNAFGAPSVAIGAAHIALRAKQSEIVPGSSRPLTFSGQPTATLFGGATLVSDPVTLALPPLAEVAVSLYLPGDTGPPASHLFALHTTYISGPGDFSAAPAFPAESTRESYYWLAGIDVLAPANAAAIVTLGDSITDGDQSTHETNGSWPALLAARLQANKSTAHIAVVNAGISGNTIRGDNSSGLARLYRDVLSVPGVKWIALLEGINDITRGSRDPARPGIAAADLIAAYRQVIDTAHLHGVKVIGCTVTPWGGSPVFNEYGESVRDAVNQWIRTGRAFDAVIDFDAATRDSKDPKRFRAEADSPDLLHPANPGYKLMADSIDLKLFK